MKKNRTLLLIPIIVITSWGVFSKISNQPDGFDWFMMIIWSLVLLVSFLNWVLQKQGTRSVIKSKVSKKVYRDKQNQATGHLIFAILSLGAVSLNVYQYIRDDVALDWVDLGWFLTFVVTTISWIYHEKQLKSLEVEEATS